MLAFIVLLMADWQTIAKHADVSKAIPALQTVNVSHAQVATRHGKQMKGKDIVAQQAGDFTRLVQMIDFAAHLAL